jgi:DNA-binding transcriptional LysR family regulator
LSIRRVWPADILLRADGGVGLALLPCYVGAAVAGLAQLSPPLPELERELWLLTHPDLRDTARVRVFLDYCVEAIARRRDLIEGCAWRS